MTGIASRGKSTLGLAFAIGLLVSLWSANAGIKSLFDSFNLVYNEEEKRGLIKLNLVSLTFTVAAIVFVLFGIAAVVVLPVAFTYIGLGGATHLIVRIGRWPILFVLVALALAFIYRYGPSRSKTKWRWITWGSAFAALAWIAGSVLFSWYAAKPPHCLKKNASTVSLWAMKALRSRALQVLSCSKARMYFSPAPCPCSR
jgi:membrane protein